MNEFSRTDVTKKEYPMNFSFSLKTEQRVEEIYLGSLRNIPVEIIINEKRIERRIEEKENYLEEEKWCKIDTRKVLLCTSIDQQLQFHKFPIACRSKK